MKYLFKRLLILLLILFSLKLIIHIFDKGHTVNYTIGNFNIKEILKTDKIDNYYFEIKQDKFKINFQINKNYNKKEKIIKEIKYYKYDDNECILPIFKKNNIYTDIMCLRDNTIIYYHDLEDKSQLNEFVKSLKKYGYDESKYTDNAKGKKLSASITTYEDNFISNHYMAEENYKGLTLYNIDKNISIFTNDVYKKPISMFYDKYYIVADYNSEYTFKKFYAINIINGNIKEIRSYDEISFDSVIQGAVDNNVYLFDKDASIQYKVSIEDETVEKVGDKNNIKYYNGRWSNMTLKQAQEGTKFNNYYTSDISGYDRVDKVGYYYYLYKKENEAYKVYRADKQNKNIKTYLFTTTDLNSIIYLDNYIYFKNNNKWFYYGDYGKRIVIENSELEFNDDITLGVCNK